MKTKLLIAMATQILCICAVAIIGIAIIGCGGDETAPETFTVSFNANGGNPTPPDQTVEKGKTVTEPAGVTKANNTLDGWYKESALTTKWNFAADTVTASITLFAKWIETPIDNITGNAGKQIPIYKTDGVSDADAVTAANNIKNAYNAVDMDSYRDLLSRGIKKIYILEGNNDSYNDVYSFDKATGILNVGSGWTIGGYKNCFKTGVYPALQETVTFPTTENPNNSYKVAIISDDQFTAAEWTTLCANVVTALETAYGTGNVATKGRFRSALGQEGGVTIVLGKNPTDYTNYKVGEDFKTLYLNVNSIATANYANATGMMVVKDPNDPLMKD